MLSTLLCLNPSIYFSMIHTLFPWWTDGQYLPVHVPHYLWPIIFTPLSHLVPPHRFHFFSITYHYHVRDNLPHTPTIFFPYMVFECHHNIRKQPLSTAIPSLNLLRDITTIGTHQHFGKILKDIFFQFLLFYQDSMALR